MKKKWTGGSSRGNRRVGYILGSYGEFTCLRVSKCSAVPFVKVQAKSLDCRAALGASACSQSRLRGGRDSIWARDFSCRATLITIPDVRGV